MKRNTLKKAVAFVLAMTLVTGGMPVNVDGGGLFDTAIVIGLMPGMGLTAYAASTYSLAPAIGQSGKTYSITPSEDTLDAVKTALAAEMSLDTETKEIWLYGDEYGMFELNRQSSTMYYKVKSKPQEIVAGKTYVIGDSLYFYADKYYNNGSVQKGSDIFLPDTDFSKGQEFENIFADVQVRLALAGLGGQLFILEEPSGHTFDSNVQPIGFKLADDSGDGSTAENYIKFEAVYASSKTDQTVIAPVAVSNLTYTGFARTLVSAATVTTGNTSGSITYSLDGTNYSADLPTGTNAGTYNVYYKVAGNDDYNEFVSASPVSVSIGKADPTADKFTFTAPSNLTYNGTAKSATVTTKEGVNGMGSFTVKYYSDENRTNEVTECKNAGTYYVGIKVNNGDNYNASENNTVLHGDNWQFTIAKADPTANAPTGLTATYGQTLSDVTLTNPSGNTPGTWSWVNAGTTSVGTVDTHTFKANFTPTDTGNYNSLSDVNVSITVNKAQPTYTAPTARNQTYYSGNVQLIGAGTVEDGCTIEYALGTDATTAPTNGWETDATKITANKSGTFYVWYKVTGTANYEDVDATCITVKISQYTVSTKSSQTWTLTMDSYPYDGTAHEAKITGNAYGKIIYYYYNADTDELLDQAPSEVGNYRVSVYAFGSTSYYSRIQTAEYSITNPVDPIDENGMANVDAFKENDTVPVSDGKIFAGWFTDETCTTAYTEDTGKAYAKFIDENILTVKAQISSGTTANSEKTSIRFITSVDSLKYQNVGFKITYNGKTIDKQMTKVYTALNANGKKISPKVFSEESNDMEAYMLNNIPQSAFSKEFMVTPYYTTQDGTIVEGKTNTFTIANMIK